MNDIDNQIAEKIIKAVQDASGWQWIKHDFGSNGWMRKGKLMVKACGGLAIRFLKRLGNWLNIKPSIAF